ncbi:MAG TPA: cytochrome c oxidase subunit II [Candidatus Binatia bacterium]|jgi:cytochrome c oxidase subunit 2|nr:cytochrome c oxidase subunit II [Candidatus Binatia bacterium]
MSAFRVDPYEKVWMLASGVLLFIFLLALGVSALYGFRLPGDEGHVEPNPASPNSPFAKPGIVERTPGRFDAYLWAQIWSFAPNEIKVPAGSTVTFHIASRDVQHSLLIERTNVNVMVLPGQVTKITARFDEPGEYRFFCAEYCGIAHHIMFGKVVVGPRS